MIRTRIVPYALALLVAIVLSLMPSAIFADLITPFESWENWSWRGQPHARPRFDGGNLPPALRAELAIFRTLVAPPSWVRERVIGTPTVYAAQFARRGVIYETAGVPPLSFAISHIVWALPFWFIAGAVLYEFLRIVRRRSRTSKRNLVPAAHAQARRLAK